MQITAIIPIFIYIISIVSGIVIFYLVSGLANERKKKLAEEAVSQIINFVLFIWLAKILMNLPLLLSDPLAALAYPSDANAFYLAIFFSIAVIIYGMKSGQIEGWPFIQTLLYILLPASFFYEFAQLTWNNDPYAFGNLVLYAILLVLFLILNGRISPFAIGSFLMAGWFMGMLVIWMIQPYVSMFGYSLELWFMVILFITFQCLIFFYRRRRAVNEPD